jgi:MFS family permease
VRGVVTAYRRVFRNRRLGALLAGEFVSSIGDWLYLVALLIIVYDRTRDPVLLGVVGAARVLPYVFLSIPAGIVADRVDRRMLLLVTDLARGAIMVVLAILVAADAPIEAIIGLTILATCFSCFFGPAIGAYLPTLVSDETDLGPANTAYATLENIAFIIGPALAAIVLSFGSLSGAFGLNALSFGVVAIVLWRLPRTTAAEPDAEEGGEGATEEPASPDAAPAWRALLVPMAALTATDVVESFVFGGLGVLTVVIAFDRLGIGEEGTGLLNAAVGVGGLAGALVSGTLVLRRRLAPPLALGAVVLAGSVAALGLSSSLLAVLLAMAFSALGSLLGSVVSATLFQRIVPDHMRGRMIGVSETISILAYAAGALALPALADRLGFEPVMIGSGLAIALAAAVAIPLLGSAAIQPLPDDEVRAALSRLPIFVGLPPARLELAERHAHVVAMRQGEVVIRQGDVADRFYVIADGSVEVTQVPAAGGPPAVLRRMGPGEAFGEIGLLTGVPRTATVTGISAGRLLALERQDFLELVGNGSGLTFPILDLHRGSVIGG